VKQLLYSILDLKSGEYDSPFRSLNDTDAMRGIVLGLRSGKPMFARFPADFALYFVGHFDTESGALVAHPAPRHVTNIQALALSDAATQKETGNGQEA